MEKMLTRLIGEDIEFRIILEPKLGNIRLDMGQLEQVIVNLAVNARQAMPKGGRITFETKNEELGNEQGLRHKDVISGRFVMLTVSDTGIGMDEKTRLQIFDPFFTTKKSGTGLGLATVEGIVKQLGGHISVFSELGVGTTFKVYFPWVDSSIDSVVSSPVETLLTGTETILLVEDEESIRNLAVRILKRAGYTVVESSNGEEALQLSAAHKGPLDLLITDVVMPRMSGPEVAEHLMTLRPGLKILYFSGYTDDMTLAHGLSESHTAFLQKPFEIDNFLAKVREVLSDGPSHEKTPKSN
jgi:CheY-like chemotaxis protein